MGAAITQLLILVGSLTTFRFVSGPTLEVPFGGYTIETTGYALCENRRPSITLASSAPSIEATVLHELAHAQDCLDDGEINGSLLPAGAALRYPSGHCVANRAEFYACWVTEQAQVRAGAASPDIASWSTPTN